MFVTKMKCTKILVTLVCTASLLAGCGAKSLVDMLTPMNESQAIVKLSEMLPYAKTSGIVVEWTKTDPETKAPNSLEYDNDNLSLTYETPSEKVVYGPVKPEVIKQLAERAKGGETVKVSDVTKSGAKVVSRKKKTGDEKPSTQDGNTVTIEIPMEAAPEK